MSETNSRETPVPKEPIVLRQKTETIRVSVKYRIKFKSGRDRAIAIEAAKRLVSRSSGSGYDCEQMETEVQTTDEDLCGVCGIGFFLPSGRCDHCNQMRS